MLGDSPNTPESSTPNNRQPPPPTLHHVWPWSQELLWPFRITAPSGEKQQLSTAPPVALQHVQRLARRGIPQAEGPVARRRQRPGAVGREAAADHRTPVALENERRLQLPLLCPPPPSRHHGLLVQLCVLRAEAYCRQEHTLSRRDRRRRRRGGQQQSPRTPRTPCTPHDAHARTLSPALLPHGRALRWRARAGARFAGESLQMWLTAPQRVATPPQPPRPHVTAFYTPLPVASACFPPRSTVAARAARADEVNREERKKRGDSCRGRGCRGPQPRAACGRGVYASVAASKPMVNRRVTT